jgi:formylglycine-generating enzyme required for sulfatase activity
MKKIAYILSLLVLLVSSISLSAQESEQYAIFNYRNDGKFNAFLNINIDSITFSCIDTLGVEHEDIVVQEVWTPDSLYRIPLSAIDSLGFRAPETKMRDGLFYIREYHANNTLSVDSLTIYFNTTIHPDSLPAVDQAIVSMTYQTPFEDGFIGRVKEINHYGDRIEVICRNAFPFEIFEQFAMVGAGISNVEGYKQLKKARRKGYWDEWEASDHIEKIDDLPGEWKINFTDIFSWTSKNPVVSVTYSALINSDAYYLDADIYIHHEDATIKLAFDWDKISKMGKEYDAVKKVWQMLEKGDFEGLKKAEEELTEKEWEAKCKIPFHFGPVFCSFEFGAMFKPLATDLKFEYTQNSTQFEHYGLHKTGKTPSSWLHDQIFPEDELDLESSGGIDFHLSKEITSTTMDLKYSGEVSVGLFAKVNASLLSKYFIHSGGGVEFGTKLTGTLDFRLQDSDFDDMNIYSRMKNTNLDWKLYYKLMADFGALPFNIVNLTWENEHPIYDVKLYLFPDFSQPVFPFSLGSNRAENETLVTNVSKRVMPIIPYYPGLAIYDDFMGNGSFNYMTESYLDPESYNGLFGEEREEKLSVTSLNLIPGHTYRCYPIVKVFGHTFQANPYTEFVCPKPLKVNTPSLLLPIQSAQQVEVEGGWGSQEVTCTPAGIVKVDQLSTMTPVGQISPCVWSVTPLKAGTATIKFRDPRSLETVSVEAKVYDNPEEGTNITVSTTDIDFGTWAYGETARQSFTVTNHGTKELTYNVNNGNVNIANGFIVEGANELRYLQPGASETFTVTAKGTGPDHYRMGVLYIYSIATKDPVSIGLKVKGKASYATPVDLGLSVKWADFNLGASEPFGGEVGEHIAWGETDSKASYSWNTYAHCNGSAETCHNLGTITATDNDAARFQWGENWRLPTSDEFKELIERCTWTWDNTGLTNGYWVKGPNGNRIFLEAAGIAEGEDIQYVNSRGLYLSGTQGDTLQTAAMLGFRSGQYLLDNTLRYCGASIRPVYNEIAPPDLTLSTNTVSLEVGGSSIVEIMAGSGSYTVVSDKPSVATAELNGSTITITPVSAGTATITVTDTQSGQTATIAVTISNNIPTAAKETFTVNGVSFNMIKVEGGTFMMGATPEQGNGADSDERPVHQVTLSDYYIGETEVTQALWTAVMGNNPSYFTGSTQLPVEQVSWNDCQEFISNLNSLTGQHFSLPTEAEWEFAARGGNVSQGYTYSGSNNLDEVGWYYYNSSSHTHDVATKASNELGLFDMSGNVCEWCQDWYAGYSSEAQTNPFISSGSGRAVRSGDYGGFARACRIADRYQDCNPTQKGRNRGLRLAISSSSL